VWPLESIKAAAISAADLVNKVYDPFDDFTRPTPPKESKKLSALEHEFYVDLVGAFWGCGGRVVLHRIPLPVGTQIDLGDQAIWHGVYTAMLALRYYVNGGGNELSDAVSNAVLGLKLHQTAHGEAKPRLIRGVSDDLKQWQDDASNDSATGHVLGIYFAWKFGPAGLRTMLAELATGLAREILTNRHALVRADGTPTTYGALEQGWKTDPLRITLALAIYGVASMLGRGDTHPFMQAYRVLFARYKSILAYPKVKLLWKENQNDTHRAAIHLAILADLTFGQLDREIYKNGLVRLRRMTAKQGNVWVNALCAFGRRLRYSEDRSVALKVLSEFTLTDKQFNNGRENYPIPMPYAVMGVRAVKWGDKYMASQPLPRYAVRPQDFFWQRNLYSLDLGSTGANADSRLNGGDYMAAYWLSRLTGILNAED